MRETASLRSGLWSVLMLAALLVPGVLQAEPLRSDLDESITARLHVSRIRIEPTKSADPDECLTLGPEELSVVVRDQRLPVDELNLDRKRPPTLHALLIDTSASMVRDLPYAQYAAGQYVEQLKPEVEKALVATFDESVVLWQGLTSNRRRLLDAVDRVRMGGLTSLLDAIFYTMRELDGHHERAVMVVLTDGADTASLHDAEDILGHLAGRPDLTIFTIGLGLQATGANRPTRDLLSRLASGTHGKFFEVTEGFRLDEVFAEIRAILENEAILAVVDPVPDAKKPVRIKIRSQRKTCKVTVVGRPFDGRGQDRADRPIPHPFADPPQIFSLAPGLDYRKLYTRTASRTLDPACSVPEVFARATAEGGWLEPTWFVRVERGITSGCGPDLVMEPGPLYSPDEEGMVRFNTEARIRTRPFSIEVPRLGELPNRPEQLMNDLAMFALTKIDADRGEEPPENGHEARSHHDYPSLVHGASLLSLRPRIAHSIFLHREYRQWALGKLGDDAERELGALQRRYIERFPDLPQQGLAEAVRYSEDGQRILNRAVHPTEGDLQKFLAAWLGDVSAHRLFVDWERERIDIALADLPAQPSNAELLDAWGELRRVFFTPSHSRILTLLAPVYDLDRECVGFWRVVLPRPSWLYPRVHGFRENAAIIGDRLDLVADIPFGFWVVDQVTRTEPEVLDHLRSGGFRSTGLVYELLGEPASQNPVGAYSRTRVSVVLESEAETYRRLELTADVRLDPAAPDGSPQPVLEALEVFAPEQPALQELLSRARAALIAPRVEEQARAAEPTPFESPN